jgi:hypothetical protein
MWDRSLCVARGGQFAPATRSYGRGWQLRFLLVRCPFICLPFSGLRHGPGDRGGGGGVVKMQGMRKMEQGFSGGESFVYVRVKMYCVLCMGVEIETVWQLWSCQQESEQVLPWWILSHRHSLQVSTLHLPHGNRLQKNFWLQILKDFRNRRVHVCLNKRNTD